MALSLSLLLIQNIFIQGSALAQSGFYSNFEKLIEIHKSNYTKKLESLTGKTSSLNDLQDPAQAELDPDFLNTVVFHTPSRYASLAAKDRCSLYDLILSNLAQGPKGELTQFIIRYKNNKGEIKTSLADRKTFFEKIAFKQCPQVEKFQAYFNLKNLSNTLKTINLETPSSPEACLEVHQDFFMDYKTPYLCFLSEQIRKIPSLERQVRAVSKSQYRKLQDLKRDLKVAKAFKARLNPHAQDYLNSLCLNLEKPKVFCDNFFKKDFWKRVATKEKSSFYMQSMCKESLNKNNLSENDYVKCARQFSQEPRVCSHLGVEEGVLTPKPDCQSLSASLNRSNLRADYSDCPGKVGNAGIVNLTRIINHFSPAVPKASPGLCHVSSTGVFAQFNQETTDGRFWNVELCYEDKLNNKEVCLPTIYGDVEGGELSLTKVVEKILRRTKGFGADQSCKLTTKEDYRPNLLEFKSGCFIVVDANKCFGTSCDYNIIWNERKISHILQKSGTKFDYFPKDFANEAFSQIKLIEQKFKLNSKSVSNVTFLKRAFEKHPEGLVHGVACSEDLLPEFFNKRFFNQCSPLPFIVDGYKTKQGLYSVVLRTAYDSLHAPRVVPWSHLFSALKDYQRLHPLNTWGLHVIY
ncbi:MAG: hypothetical protein WD025_04635 [Bacteriovoracaceae bacterium]